MQSRDKNIKALESEEYYAALDGFRGILALAVAIYHTIWISHPQTWRFFENGPVIIDLFFAFSGFLMWRLYACRLETSVELGQFIKRRFARLYPLHLFMLLVFFGFAVLRLVAHKIGLAEQSPGEILPFSAGSSDNISAFLQHLTLTNALGLSEGLTFNPPSWTIGAEFCTYLIFAAMMMWFRPKRAVHFISILLGVVAIYASLFMMKPDMNITYDYGFLRCVAGFFTGILAAVSFPLIRNGLDSFSKHFVTALEVSVVLASIGFVVFMGGKAQFLVGLVIYVFVVIFAADRGAVSEFLSHRIFQYLAKISYSVYLVHVIISILFSIVFKQFFGALPTGWAANLWLGVYLVVVIGVSHCTYHLIERPSGKWIRNWKPPQKQVAESASSV